MTERVENGEGFTITYDGAKLQCLDYDEDVYRVTLIPVALVQEFEKLPESKRWADIHEFVREAVRLHLDTYHKKTVTDKGFILSYDSSLWSVGIEGFTDDKLISMQRLSDPKPKS